MKPDTLSLLLLVPHSARATSSASWTPTREHLSCRCRWSSCAALGSTRRRRTCCTRRGATAPVRPRPIAHRTSVSRLTRGSSVRSSRTRDAPLRRIARSPRSGRFSTTTERVGSMGERVASRDGTRTFARSELERRGWSPWSVASSSKGRSSSWRCPHPETKSARRRRPNAARPSFHVPPTRCSSDGGLSFQAGVDPVACGGRDRRNGRGRPSRSARKRGRSMRTRGRSVSAEAPCGSRRTWHSTRLSTIAARVRP